MIEINTEYNFKMLEQRILDGIRSVDLKELRNIIANIKSPTLVTGTGGSNAAAYFASRVLNETGFTRTLEPRDVIYEDLQYFKTLLAVTYGNNNHGINVALDRAKREGLDTVTLTRLTDQTHLDRDITYQHELEKSFISIAATLTPMAVMLLKNLQSTELVEYVNALFTQQKTFDIDPKVNVYEIMSGDHTKTAAKILESNLTEAGLAIPIVHDKYNYCHGRSTISYGANHSLVYLINGRRTELDRLLIEELRPYYQTIIVLSASEANQLLGEYNLAVQAMHLSKDIAAAKCKGLSQVDYSPVVRKLYRFKGDM